MLPEAERCSQTGGFQNQPQSRPGVLNCSDPGALKCQWLGIIEESSPVIGLAKAKNLLYADQVLRGGNFGNLKKTI